MQKIVEVYYGSKLYGTMTPESDIDKKGIFIPEKRDIILGRIPKSIVLNTNKTNDKNTFEDQDVEYYSLHYFIELACRGETCTIDMLNAPDWAIIHKTDVWDVLVRERNRFYSNNMKAFVGYARSQAIKYGVKGNRLNTAKEVVKILESCDRGAKLTEIWELLPKNIEHIYYGEVRTSRDGPLIRTIKVCSREIQETVTVEYAISVLKHVINKYGNRTNSAEGNKGRDWKAISHSIRIAIELEELYKYGKIMFPLDDADMIKEIKKGKVEYNEVSTILDYLMREIEFYSEVNPQDFPDKVNYKYWDDFIFDTIMNHYFS